jgi:aminoglycoside/choline kinase family phosphotransferase
MTEKISEIYQKLIGFVPEKIEQLPPSASPRKYFRVFANGSTAIVAFNTNVEENAAFIGFAKHFRSLGLPVPEIYATEESGRFYVLEDLGDTQLFHLIKKNGFTDATVDLFRKSLDKLLEIQFEGLRDLDLSLAFPRAEFDQRSIMWDLHYFKYYVLKLAEIDFNEERLENDFETFTNFLLEAKREYFLYRDFQTRNIMIINEEPYFIDFQGGRKGALQYDVASLLFDANANMPKILRNELLTYYINNLRERDALAATDFMRYYYHFVLVRMLQALGAFGFRGLVQRKQLFIDAIPPAIKNLQDLLDDHFDESIYPELYSVLRKLKNFEAK